MRPITDGKDRQTFSLGRGNLSHSCMRPMLDTPFDCLTLSPVPMLLPLNTAPCAEVTSDHKNYFCCYFLTIILRLLQTIIYIAVLSDHLG